MDAPGNRDTVLNFTELAQASASHLKTSPPLGLAPSAADPGAKSLKPTRATKEREPSRLKVEPVTKTPEIPAGPRTALRDEAAASVTDLLWDKFRKVYELEMDVRTLVAVRRRSQGELVTMRVIPEREAPEKVAMLERIDHKAFHGLCESICFDDCRYLIFDHIPISLAEIVLSPPYPTERELAAIVGQIVKGLVFLESLGLEHGLLDCATVLIDDQGVVKISAHESSKRSSVSRTDLRAFGRIVMELMQKYVNESGHIGVEDMSRWPPNSDAVDFLSMTGSVSSANKLSEHKLLKFDWKPAELKWMVALSAITVRRPFRYSFPDLTDGPTRIPSGTLVS